MTSKSTTKLKKSQTPKRAIKTLKVSKAAAVKSATIVPDKRTKENTMTAQDQVTHLTFGTGTVLMVDGDKLQIKFAKVGVKWIREDFVKRV